MPSRVPDMSMSKSSLARGGKYWLCGSNTVEQGVEIQRLHVLGAVLQEAAEQPLHALFDRLAGLRFQVTGNNRAGFLLPGFAFPGQLEQIGVLDQGQVFQAPGPPGFQLVEAAGVLPFFRVQFDLFVEAKIERLFQYVPRRSP